MSDSGEEITEEQVLKGIRKHAQREYKTVFDKTISKNLEEGTFNYSIERVAESLSLSVVTLLKSKDEILEKVPFHDLKTAYKQVFMKVLCNIKFNENNEFVKQKIIEKEWLAKDVAKMHREELFPKKWDKLYKDRTEDLKKKRIKGAHRCPKCKSWYTSHTEAQTKSADESCSVFVKCECGYNWRYG
jgi:DNA-directed RNA polymerase subunit M/transcription elongation factor TFIIS